MAYKIRKEVRQSSGYHLDQPAHRVKLNQNESAYDLPATLKRRVLTRLARLDWNRYPEPFADTLRAKIAAKERWSRDGILVANGSNVLTQALVTATAVGGRVLMPDPSFSLYAIYGALFGSRVSLVPLEADFSLDPDRFIRRMKREKPDIVFIPNPNAPTGTAFAAEALKKIVRAASCVVVIDEAYYPFSNVSLKSVLKRYPQLVLMRTFSKAYSLGGARIGYLMAAPKLVAELSKMVAPFCVNALSCVVAETILDSPRYVAKIVREVREERAKLYDGLRELPGVTAYPSAANFILFRSRQPKKLYQGLVKKGILIRDVSDGKRLKNCLRVTVGTPAENRRFIRAIRQLV